jgi:hypothetical protein
MSINESTATALVRFTGLGIVVFNKEKNRGEIAIIRDDKHELSLKIQAPRFVEGSEKDLVAYEDIAVYRDLQKKGVSIEIAARGNSKVAGYDIYQAAGDFDRLTCSDPNDYRWVVDMSGLHSSGLSASQREDRYPISKLFIENGLFYVHKLDTEMFFEKVEKGADGSEVRRETFGNVAETIGVKLDADEVVFTIKTGESEESHSLSRGSLPYRIEINNMNYAEDALVSDMPDYYKYFSLQGDVNFEFERITDGNAAAGTGVNHREFCHPLGGGGVVSIDEFDG